MPGVMMLGFVFGVTERFGFDGFVDLLFIVNLQLSRAGRFPQPNDDGNEEMNP